MALWFASASTLVADPEEVQAELQQGLEIEEVLRRAHHDVVGVCEAELEQVDLDEGRQRGAGDGQIKVH